MSVYTPSAKDIGKKLGRPVWLKSERYQLIGKSDLIESADSQVIQSSTRGKKGEWDNDELQVYAQALCLEEMLGKQ